MNKFDLSKFLVENKLTQLGRLTEMGDDSSEGYMGTDYESSEDMAVDMAKKGITETEDEVEADYSKYKSVEELMKEIESSTNEAAMKHKMERVEKAYKYLEEKASSLEEGGDANFINPTKLKEMKNSAKKLRGMHDKLLKEYDKKYAKKKIVEKTPVGESVGFQLGAPFKVGDYVRVGEGNSYDDWVYPFFGYVKSVEGDLAVVENEDGVDIYDVHIDKMELVRR
jgi:hypothetical protein